MSAARIARELREIADAVERRSLFLRLEDLADEVEALGLERMIDTERGS